MSDSSWSGSNWSGSGSNVSSTGAEWEGRCKSRGSVSKEEWELLLFFGLTRKLLSVHSKVGYAVLMGVKIIWMVCKVAERCVSLSVSVCRWNEMLSVVNAVLLCRGIRVRDWQVS